MLKIVNAPINDFIQEESAPGVCLMRTVVRWRDKEPNVIRIVMTGLALIPLGLINLIDCVLSAVATVFTSPLLLVGNSIPKCFANRTIIVGSFCAVSLIFAQYHNVTKNNLRDSLNDIFWL